MNLEQLQLLDALEIPVWVDKTRQTATQSFAVCLVQKHDWDNDCQALFTKIIAAMKWPSYEVVHSFNEISTQSQITVIFGDDWTHELDSQVQVPSLSQMLRQADAKKLAWQRLKPYTQ